MGFYPKNDQEKGGKKRSPMKQRLANCLAFRNYQLGDLIKELQESAKDPQLMAEHRSNIASNLTASLASCMALNISPDQLLVEWVKAMEKAHPTLKEKNKDLMS